MERDLHADLPTVEWVINAYSPVFGVLTVSGGRFADLFGRRRAFVAGSIMFAVCSLVAALAPTAPVLIGARAAMAVGGALICPRRWR
jgi:DHA2 family methylenomycin A resistance protein-like MFS transporter